MPSAPSPLRVAMTVEQAWQPVPGGSGTYVAEMSRELAERVDLTGVSAWHRAPAPPDWAPSGRLRRVPLPRVALYEAWQRVRLPRIEWTAGAVDLVHATTWAVPPTARPLVVSVHDLAFLAEPDHFTARGVGFFTRALEHVRRRADAVLVPSTHTRDACIEVGIPAERLHVVPLGSRLPATSPQDDADFCARHGLDRPYVLWTGTVEPRKNLPAVLAGYALLRRTRPDVDLVLVGPSGWGDVDVPTGASVHRLGMLSRVDLARAYAGAAVFCFPSLREGFGLPVLEAMSVGVPVVTSAGTSCAEVAGDAGLLVDPHDHQALAAALETACGPAGPGLAAASRARAAEFSWTATAEQTLEVDRSVADRQRAATA